MLEVGLILALGGLLAAASLRRGAHARSAAGGGRGGGGRGSPAKKRGSSGSLAGAAADSAEGGEWSGRDGQLLRELQDDLELRLRRVRKMPPGEERR